MAGYRISIDRLRGSMKDRALTAIKQLAAMNPHRVLSWPHPS
jgi:hypothetical protein